MKTLFKNTSVFIFILSIVICCKSIEYNNEFQKITETGFDVYIEFNNPSVYKVEKANILILNNFSSNSDELIQKNEFKKYFKNVEIDYCNDKIINEDFIDYKNADFHYVLLLIISDLKGIQYDVSETYRRVLPETDEEKAALLKYNKEKENAEIEYEKEKIRIEEERKNRLKERQKRDDEEWKAKQEKIKEIPKEVVIPAILADIFIIQPSKIIIDTLIESTYDTKPKKNPILDNPVPDFRSYEYKKILSKVSNVTFSITTSFYDLSTDNQNFCNNEKISYSSELSEEPDNNWIKITGPLTDKKISTDELIKTNLIKDLKIFTKLFESGSYQGKKCISFESTNDKYMKQLKELLYAKKINDAENFLIENFQEIKNNSDPITLAKHYYNLGNIFYINNQFLNCYKSYTCAYQLTKNKKYEDMVKLIEDKLITNKINYK